jgi:arsenite-transporting ATPase
MTFLESPTPYLFFTGKGGVGKTSLACATAVRLADRGKVVLLVSTDPASNLDQVLGVKLGPAPTTVPGVPGLSALNIDPQAAAAAYRERSVGPYRGLLPDDAVRQMEEQLSGACTVEIAAFDEFTGLMTGAAGTAGFDHVVFDTAPTGHTLRLLRLPGAWTNFLDANTRGASCLGPGSALKTQRARYAAAVAALGDPARSTVVLVTRPEASALAEAARTSRELRDLGLSNQQLVVNGVFAAAAEVTSDPTAEAMGRRTSEALAAIPQPLRALPSLRVPLQGHNLVGLRALRHLLGGAELPAPPPDHASEGLAGIGLCSLSEVIDDIASGSRGLVMVMGKGGVGKTTVAAAVAVELASRGLPVHLTTTDPAAHLADALTEAGADRGGVPGLRVSRIDPAAETRAYTERVMATAGAGLDADGRALLEEDLRSPCTEEVAVFHAFSQAVAEARSGFVVMDTAPTGHTLLLLDATGAYHRDVVRNAEGGGSAVTPLMSLRDPQHTKVILVTLPETTPVLEAASLQADLRRAGIEPYAWVVNNSLAAAGSRDPVLRARARSEVEQIRIIRQGLGRRVAVVPWAAEVPVGPRRLRDLAARGTGAGTGSGART